MFKFIQLQFLMGKISADQVQSFAPNWISIEEAALITA